MYNIYHILTRTSKYCDIVALEVEMSPIFSNAVGRFAHNIVHRQACSAYPRNSGLRNSPLLAAQQAKVMQPAETV